MLRKTDVAEKLARLRNKQVDSDRVLQEVHAILREDETKRDRIKKTLGSGKSRNHNAFDFDLLQFDNIYHLEQIKQICIDYRLRFLDVAYFKGDIPEEAVSKIKHLERAHDIEIQGYKIIAPSKLFKLNDKDDPLLFAPIGNGYYYLIHKWGNDLHPLRKLLMWPFKNIANLTLLVLLVSYLVTMLVPDGLFSKQGSAAEFWIIFFFMFKSIASVVIFYGFALGKNFNPAIWNSKYFNA